MARRSDVILDEEGNLRPRNVAQIIDARAPQADLSRNIPMSPAAPYSLTAPGQTPKGIWDQMFKPKGLMVNTSQPIQQPQQQTPSVFGAGLQQTSIPSLTTMANGGMNHQQKWMQPPVATPPASLNQFSTTPADANAIAQRYGANTAPAAAYDWKKQLSWASGFRS